jgi:hypothetical protein
MSNPHTWAALQQVGLIPAGAAVLIGSNDPLKIEFKLPEEVQQQLENK